MVRVDHVVFITDFTRLAPRGVGIRASGMEPLRWLWHVLRSAPVWREAGLRCELPIPWQGEHPEQGDFASRNAWNEYLEDPESAWARHFHHDAEELFPRWWRKVLSADLVIGFELPPAFRRALHKRGKRYISFHIHALRFLRDLCFGAYSNDVHIANALRSTAVMDEEIALQVHRFRALCGYVRPAALKLPEELPVLIGQTPRDSVLIRPDGSFADWVDFEAELDQRLADFDACVLLEHPYREDSRAISEYLRCRHGKSVISTKTSGYGLIFTLERTPKVITLASSLGVEASAAGLPVDFLLGDPRRLMLMPEQEEGTLSPLGHSVISDAVWRRILGRPSSGLGIPSEQSAWGVGDHYLRDSLDGWGYPALRNRLAGTHARTRWLPSAYMSADRESELLDQMHPPPRWQGEISLVRTSPPLRLNESRRFSGSDPGFQELLGAGFHLGEAWGAWSRPGRSELIIPVQPDADAVLEVSLEVRCFEGVLLECPVLEIFSGDELLGVVMFRPMHHRSARVNVTCRADRAPVCLVMRMPDGASPEELNLANDPRQIAFGVAEINLRLSKGQAPKRTGVSVWGLPSDDGSPSSLPHLLLLAA
jgi:hypothetical protein